MTRIAGSEIDDAGRCAHYHSVRDVVAIRFPCCDPFWACAECHAGNADHTARPWPATSFDTRAVLCGVCGHTMSIATYLRASDACAACAAPFNPRCVLHHHLYFDVPAAATEPA